MGLLWLDGRLTDSSEPTLRADDRGFVFGDGLFETMRARGKHVFRLVAHLNRLRAGAGRLGIPVPEGLAEAIDTLLEAGRFGDSALRLTLSRGPGDETLEPPPDPKPTVAISLRRLPAIESSVRERGLAVAVSDHRISSRSIAAGLKALGYLPNVLARAAARCRGADDALVLNEREALAECTASNLFWVGPSGELRTPSVGCGILEGVTRAAVLELAGTLGVPVVEGEWEVDALRSSREAFATSSLRGIAPITVLDGERVGSGRPGELTMRLHRAYEELVGVETSG